MSDNDKRYTDRIWAVYAAQETTCHYFAPQEPEEYWRDVGMPSNKVEEPFENIDDYINSGKPVPIDIVLGCYNHEKHRIHLCPGNLVNYAKYLNVDVEYLTTVVRIHELGHALVARGISLGHGLPLTAGKNNIPTVRDDQQWHAYEKSRDEIYLKLGKLGFGNNPSYDHEFLAQLITRMVVRRDDCRSELEEVFKKLMDNSPPEYQLNYSDGELSCAQREISRVTFIDLMKRVTKMNKYSDGSLRKEMCDVISISKANIKDI